MEPRVYGYARVSSTEQNLDRQINALKDFGVSEDNILNDKESGESLYRDSYQYLRNRLLREGDTLVVTSLDRLSRKKPDIKEELEYFSKRGVRVKILDLPTTLIDLPDGQGWILEMVHNILIEVLGTMAEQERVAIKQRQREGIDAAHKRNVKFGRPAWEKPEHWDDVVASWRRGEIMAVEAMKKLNVPKSTFYKMANEDNIQ